MKRTNISVFIPHIGCPHRCSFCDQRSISGAAHAPSPEEVAALLEEQAPHLAERGMQAEIAFFGGSFTAVPREYMVSLLECAHAAVQKHPEVYCGIRCSTRPDCVDGEIIAILKKYGMTAVELGAQSMSDEVLTANERGHSAEDVRRASRLIRESGISLGLQMMTGLYCPGCGGTRAVRALLSGHPVLSFLYHPVVPYMASVAVWAAVSWILYFATGNRRFRPELDDRIAYAAAGIVILNFIIKNGLLVFAGIDVIGRLPGV